LTGGRNKVEFNYDDLVRRNWPLITSEEQQRIKNTRLLIAGCGIGSLTAEAAVRMGFGKLTVVDEDIVTVHNMNRQAFDYNDVGQNKAKATRQRLLRINPQCDVEAVPNFLNDRNVKALVTACDIVVDAVDIFDFNAILLLHKEARRQNKPIVTGVNFGWGAAVMVFTPTSMTIEQLITSFTNIPEDKLLDANTADLMAAIPSAVMEYMPSYILGVLATMAQGPRIRDAVTGFPQPVVAAMQNVSFGIAALTRLALGLPISVAPKPVYFDSWLSLTPTDNI